MSSEIKNLAGDVVFVSDKETVKESAEKLLMVEVDLCNTNFSYADLSDVDFSGKDLRGINFTGANLTNVNFSNADLSGTNLSNTNLVGTNFSNANLTRTNFRGSTITSANYDGANLTWCNLHGGKLESVQNVMPVKESVPLKENKIGLDSSIQTTNMICPSCCSGSQNDTCEFCDGTKKCL